MMHFMLVAALAAACIAMSADPASAEPVSITILTFVGIEATATAVAVTTFALYTAASIGLSYLAQALRKKPSQPQTSSGGPVGGTTGTIQSGGAVPRSFIVGQAATAGSLVYANTFGANGNTPNAYLVQVIALSDLPVAGLAGLVVNGVTVAWDPDVTPTSDGVPVADFAKDGADHLWVRFYNGSQSVADARLVELFGADPDRPYAADRVGQGVCYAVMTSLTDPDLFSGFPQFKFVLNGVPLYDRRADSTAGGSGDQRWSDPTTWVMTENPIVVVENILRGIRYAGQWLYGAQTVAVPQLPAASWVAAASECDVAVDLAAGGTEPQFKAGGEITFDTQPADAIEELLKACNGRLAEIGGTYKVRAGAAGSAIFSFTDADILSTDKQTFTPFPSLGDVVNHVTAQYTSPAEGWVVKDAPPLQDNDLEAADGGRRQSVAVQYGFVTSGTAVQRLMKAERDTNRAWRRHALPMPPEAFVLEPLDVVSWTSARNGYETKLFEVATADDLPNLNMGLVLKELDPNAYDWDPETDEAPVDSVPISIVRPPAQPIIDWYASPHLIIADNGIKRPAIQLGWDQNTFDVSGVRFEIRLKATGEVVLTGETDRLDRGSIVVSQNLAPATTYQARGQYRPASPRDVLWSDWLDVTTPTVYIEEGELSATINRALEAVAPAVRDANDVAESVALIAARVMQDADDNAILIERNRQDLHVKANGISAAVVTETQARIDGDAAEASARLLVKADVDANTAAIAAEAVARADGDSAVAATVTALAATVDDNTAAISSEATARADADSAIVSTATTLATKVDDISASYTFRASVSSNVPLGALSAVDLQVRADSGASWGEAGLQLAVYSYSGVLYSRARIYADLTEIGSTASGGFVPVFSVQSVNGVNKIALAGDALPDDVISSRSMVAGADEAQIVATGSSDVSKTFAGWNNSGSGDVIMSATFPTLAGEALDIEFECILDSSAEGNSQVVGPATLKLTMNDSQVGTTKLAYQVGGVANFYSSYNYFPVSIRRLATGCEAGDTTVKAILILPVADGARTLHVRYPEMLIRRIKKPLMLDGSNTVSTATKSYRASYYTGSTSSKSGADIGTANANRLVVVAVGWQSATSNTPSLTVGGLAAQLITTSTKNNTRMALFAVPKSTGTTADIVASLPSGATKINFVVWAVVAGSTAPVHYGFAFWGGPATGDVATGAINIQDKSVLVAAVYGGSGASNYAATWSGGDTITERADAVPSGSGIRHAEYDLSGTENVAGRALTITQTQSGAPPYDDFVWVAGVWR